MSVNLYIHVFIKHSILSNPLLAILTKFQTKTTGVMTYKSNMNLHMALWDQASKAPFSHIEFSRKISKYM